MLLIYILHADNLKMLRRDLKEINTLGSHHSIKVHFSDYTHIHKLIACVNINLVTNLNIC
jgi:hypothetical protein